MRPFPHRGRTAAERGYRQPGGAHPPVLTVDTATLYVDTGGGPLYKRGYKPAAVEAPLKENLAAGILRLGWQADEALVDPMCGSGTFPDRGRADGARHRAGLGRGFAFERLRIHDRGAWAALRRAAEQRRKPARVLPIFGSDWSASGCDAAAWNLDAAGLADCVRLDRADVLERTPPAAAAG